MEDKDLVSDENLDVSDAEKVSRKELEKLLRQRKADQEKNRELSLKLEAIEREKQELEQKKLEEEGNWRELYESKNKTLAEMQNEVKSYKTKLEETEKTFLSSAKLAAVIEKLPAKISKKEYYNFIDVDSVLIDPETGDFDEASISNVANDFVKEHSRLLDFTNSKKLPNDAPHGNDSLSRETWLKMSPKDQRKNLHKVIASQKK